MAQPAPAMPSPGTATGVAAGSSAGAATPGWQTCAAMASSDAARLACFDNWARSQRGEAVVPAPLASTQGAAAGALQPGPSAATTPLATAPAAPPTAAPAATAHAAAEAAAPSAAVPPAPAIAVIESGCHAGQYSNLSRFWELEQGTDCGTFGIRGFRPISLSVVSSDSVNRQPSSPTPGHTAATATNYRNTENRIQLSIRTKIAKDLLTRDGPLKDSLWFAYTQQSYWQLFSGSLSRPFRATDHEPELIYVYPTNVELPGRWRMTYGGLAINHQSNGQNLPLSRSWNRTYLMAGFEQGNTYAVQARIWKRLRERSGSDDNPDISDLVGRGEVAAYWNVNKDNTLGLTVRHSLARQANGSVRLEWLKALAPQSPDKPSGLRLHTQLFTGYGDSMIDYNRRRTMISVGLSLVDF
jgi:phospholipase A1